VRGKWHQRKHESKLLKSTMDEATKHLEIRYSGTSIIDHAVTKGAEREDALRDFLTSHLPQGYGVLKGMSYDFLDTQSKQIDLLIYRVRDAPFVKSGTSNLIPCESLIAAIEVKSILSLEEINDCYKKAASIRRLKPFGKKFSDARPRGDESAVKPRCFFSVFAFESDLVAGHDWLDREFRRFSTSAQELKISLTAIDRVVVNGRGVVNLPAKKGHDSLQSGVSPVQHWYVHLLNHLYREERRQEIDLEDYLGPDKWRSVND
jgi:hypothetical protein